MTYISGAESKAVPATSKSTYICNYTFEESEISLTQEISNDFVIAMFFFFKSSSTTGNKGRDLKSKFSNREYFTA